MPPSVGGLWHSMIDHFVKHCTHLWIQFVLCAARCIGPSGPCNVHVSVWTMYSLYEARTSRFALLVLVCLFACFRKDACLSKVLSEVSSISTITRSCGHPYPGSVRPAFGRSTWTASYLSFLADGMRCSRGWSGTPPNLGLLIWLEPGLSHVTWVDYDATMCLACLVCSILLVLHHLRFGLFVLQLVRTGLEH